MSAVEKGGFELIRPPSPTTTTVHARRSAWKRRTVYGNVKKHDSTLWNCQSRLAHGENMKRNEKTMAVPCIVYFFAGNCQIFPSGNRDHKITFIRQLSLHTVCPSLPSSTSTFVSFISFISFSYCSISQHVRTHCPHFFHICCYHSSFHCHERCTFCSRRSRP
jgi:hypothetical protein